MKKFYINFKEDLPKYKQISQHIKKLINNNCIADGERLPTIRKYSKFLEVNTVTIVKAYELLENEGYAKKKMGSGTYAKRKEGKRNILKEYSSAYKKLIRGNLKNFIDFTGETLSSEFFPVQTFKNVLNEVLDRDGSEAFIYQDALGYRGLRESVSNYFWENKVDPENILIVSGAQQGIDIISKAIINVNDNVIIEKPSYSGAINVFKWRRANIIEINMDTDGIDIDNFEKILKKNKVKCFYMMPYFQNPTGVTYSIEKKKRILELAEIYDFFVIEDDYLSDIIYNDKIKYNSLKSMDKNDRVIYIKSFSKIFLPGIRIGYIIPPKKFSEIIQTLKINTDRTTSSLMQRALDIYIRKGFWKKHIDFLNEEYKKRYEFLLYQFNNVLKDKVNLYNPNGGLNFFVEIKGDKINCIDLFNGCKEKNVLITPGVIYYLNSEDGLKYFKIGFSQADIYQIDRGINIINDIL
ncbi:PLP-dependent aminotransferase family protein [Clostridium sediminicola]|uniref:MocR-like pyridoxine biosynthesis transcription factor PdxR n=1 Tax=Clostridium sediminicola TaxID=3114879 RepID=UPI0031F27D54